MSDALEVQVEIVAAAAKRRTRSSALGTPGATVGDVWIRQVDGRSHCEEWREKAQYRAAAASFGGELESTIPEFECKNIMSLDAGCR